MGSRKIGGFFTHFPSSKMQKQAIPIYGTPVFYVYKCYSKPALPRRKLTRPWRWLVVNNNIFNTSGGDIVEAVEGRLRTITLDPVV